MDVSFTILTWNAEKSIEKCIRSLLVELNKSQFEYEIFIVDNGSNDKTIAIVQSFHTQYPRHIIPIYLKNNMGTTYSRNLALKQTKGKYICILDSDVEILPGTITQLINTLKNNKKAGLVAPKLIYPNGHLQKSTDVFPTIITKMFRYFFLKVIENHENNRQHKIGLQEVDYAISALWMMKDKVVQDIGLLDENIFYAPEDVDYCLRIWKTGYKVIYNSNILCIHHAQEISRGLKINISTINHIRGLFYYFRKHKYFFNRPKNVGVPYR